MQQKAMKERKKRNRDVMPLPRRRKYFSAILGCLNNCPLTASEVAISLGIERTIAHRNLKHALGKGLVKRDSDGLYALTALGIAMSKAGSKSKVKTYTFELQSAPINNLQLPLDSRFPYARCTILSDDADFIKEHDKPVALDEIPEPEAYTIVENRTTIKSAATLLTDRINDAIGGSMGLASVSEGAYADRLIMDSPGFPVGHDIRKRLLELANRDFTVVIEYHGRDWVTHQDPTEIEKMIEKSVPDPNGIRKRMPVRPKDERLKLAGNFVSHFPLSDYEYAQLESKERLFASRQRAREKINPHFDAFLPEYRTKGINKVLQMLEDRKAISYHKKTMYYVKVDQRKLEALIEEEKGRRPPL
jgi:hypothetical protein